MIQRLKSGDIVITFKEETTEYKKGNNWVIKIFKVQATYIYYKIMMLVKGLSNKNITKAYTDPERLFEDLKRKNIPSIIRIKLKYI